MTETGRFATGAVDFDESRSQNAKCNTKDKTVFKLKVGNQKVTDTATPSTVQKKEWGQLIESIVARVRGFEVIEARHGKERNQNE